MRYILRVDVVYLIVVVFVKYIPFNQSAEPKKRQNGKQGQRGEFLFFKSRTGAEHGSSPHRTAASSPPQQSTKESGGVMTLYICPRWVGW